MNIIHILINWAIPFFCATGFAYIIKKLKENDNSNKAMKNSQLALIRSQIVSKCENYMKIGYLPEYARYCLDELFKNYKILGGNHGVEILVEQCFKLPPQKSEVRSNETMD